MSRRGADEISGSPELQARMLQERMRPAGPATMNAASRDELIMRLHNRGYTPAQIGKVVGLTRRGAAARLKEFARVDRAGCGQSDGDLHLQRFSVPEIVEETGWVVGTVQDTIRRLSAEPIMVLVRGWHPPPGG